MFIELTGINVTGILPVIRFVVCKADSDSVAFLLKLQIHESHRIPGESPFSVALRGGNIMESRAKIKVSGGAWLEGEGSERQRERVGRGYERRSYSSVCNSYKERRGGGPGSDVGALEGGCQS